MIEGRVDWAKILTRQITPQIIPIVSSPKYYFFDNFGAGFKNQLYIPKGRKHEFYFSGAEWGAFASTVVGKIKASKQFIAEHTETCVAACDEIKALTREIRQSDLAQLDVDALKEYYSRYLSKFDEYYLFMWTPHIIEEYLEEGLRKELNEELDRQGRADLFDEYFNTISTKTKLNLAEQEEIELLEIAARLQEKGGEVDDEVEGLIEAHTWKWMWLPFYSLEMSLWKKSYFADRVTKFEDPASELENRRNDLAAKTEALFRVQETLRKNQTLQELIDITQDYLFLRTDRTDTLRIILYDMRGFLEEIGRRANWKYEEVIYLTPDELLMFLNGDRLPPRSTIQERQKHFLILTKGEGPIDLVSEADEIRRIIDEELGPERERVEEGELVVRGTGVYPGVVTGPVKLIESVAEGRKMEEGDILVTTMTTPEMVEIYHKAKGIVTDEGGITCHAAIISRELKIPCVIGTGEATSVFSDGMLVEVNSKEGVVKSVVDHGE